MLPTPYAKLLVRIDGGALQSGGLTVAGGAVITFAFENTTGWSSYKLYADGPEEWPLPAGWTDEDGTYTFSQNGDTPPADITLPLNTTAWGKYAYQLVVNGTLQDSATMLNVESVHGSVDIGVMETAHFGGSRRKWVRDLRRLARFVEGLAGTPFSLSGQAQGDIIYHDGSGWTRLPAGTAGQSLQSGGPDADVSWGTPPLTIAGQTEGDLLVFTGDEWARLAVGTAEQVLKGGTTPAFGSVTTLAGVAGVATVSAPRVRWGSTGRGTDSIEAFAQTTTDAVNQTLATIDLSDLEDHVFDLTLRAAARDTGASGGYRGEWFGDLFSRRTGTNSGNLERQGATPTVGNPKGYGSLVGASFDVAISSNTLLVRGSPGVPANVNWTLEICLLLNGAGAA